MKPRVLLLGMVVVVHLTLGLVVGSPAIHTGGDNAAYISLGYSLSQDGSYRELWDPLTPPHSKYPPVYPAFLALLILAGVKSWTAFQTSSLIFTALATALCFLWVERLADWRRAAVVALLFGMSPVLLYSSQWILSDPLFLVLSLGCLLLLASGPESASQKKTRKTKTTSSWLGLPLRQLVNGLYPGRRSLVLGFVLAAMAYFTRSAGLPLIVAIGIWLALNRSWKAMGGFAALVLPPMALWSLRAAGEYISEFWLINPYTPDLGRVGLLDFMVRVGKNLLEYTTVHIPGGLAELDGVPGIALGVALSALTLAGWWQRSKVGMGVGELFFILYAGLLLVWPNQWAADRFAMPLFPFVLLYASSSLLRLPSHLPGGLRQSVFRFRLALVAVATLIVGLPSAISAYSDARSAVVCRANVRMAGPLRCATKGVGGFYDISIWAGSYLPEDEIVISRKPRIFYVLSGLQSSLFPFTVEQEPFFQMADSLGARYVVSAGWDDSSVYMSSIIGDQLHRFCLLTGYSIPGYQTFLFEIDPETDALAALPTPAAPDSIASNSDGSVINSSRITKCAEWDGQAPSQMALTSPFVPILDK